MYLLSAGIASACSDDGAYTRLAKEIQLRFAQKKDTLAGQVYLTGKKFSKLRNANIQSDDQGCQARKKIELVLRAVTDTLSSDGVVMLGEIHDNDLHHWLQAEIVKLAADENTKPGIVFEQFVRSQQDNIDRFLKDKSSIQGAPEQLLKRFKAAVQWQNSGWSKYNYDELLAATLASGFRIHAGDADRDEISSVARGLADGVPQSEQQRLRLSVLLGSAFDTAMIDEIDQAHCGLMPRSAYKGMAYAQRLRDARLADALLTALQSNDGAILIAGNGHVRLDRGVGWYLKQRDPKRKIFSVTFIETKADQPDPLSYLGKDPNGRPAIDAIVFTPAVQRNEPCDALRKKFKKKQ